MRACRQETCRLTRQPTGRAGSAALCKYRRPRAGGFRVRGYENVAEIAICSYGVLYRCMLAFTHGQNSFRMGFEER